MVFPVRRNEHIWDAVLVWGMVVFTAGMGALMIKVPQKGLFWMTMILMGGITAYFWYAVRAMRGMTYSVDGRGIGVHYGLMHLYVPFSDIVNIEIRPKINLGMRLAGSEWPGYYSGYFSEFGEKRISRIYATHKDNVVRIVIRQYNLIITPEDLDGFLDAVRTYWRPHPELEQLLTEAFDGPAIWQTGPGRWGLILNLAALLGLGFYIYHLTTTVSLMPMHYDLHGQVDRYGRPAELYGMLIAPVITAPILAFISHTLSRKGIPAWESAALLLIPLATTIFMAVVVISMTPGSPF